VFLALRELRRAKVRFGLLVAAIGLLVFLILTQQALQDGLITGFVGAIRKQSAPVLVYSVDGQRTFQGSVITPDLEQAIVDVDGVGEAGKLGQGTYTVAVDGGDESDAAVIGYEKPGLGDPTELSAGRRPEAPGEAVGSANDFSLGDEVVVTPGGSGVDAPAPLTVVGLAEDAQIQVTPTLFVAWPDYESVVQTANPDATAVLPSAMALRPEPGVTDAELAKRVNDASDEADALTRSEAADETPGVAEVRQSFQVIFLLYGLVVPLVTGLFFLIVTFQKSASLTLLHAIGARSATLVRSLLVQVLIVMGIGIAFGVALYTPLSQAQAGSIALRFNVGAVVFWSVLLLVLGLASALVAARRVLAIDPLEATVGGGQR
jgi:putative ABC transport system permease protein